MAKDIVPDHAVNEAISGLVETVQAYLDGYVVIKPSSLSSLPDCYNPNDFGAFAREDKP